MAEENGRSGTGGNWAAPGGAQSPPQGAPDTGSGQATQTPGRWNRLTDSALDMMVPESENAGETKRKRLARVAYLAGAALLAMVVGTYVGIRVTNMNAEATKRAESEVEDKIDASNPPFRSTVEYNWDRYSMKPFSWVLDRPLTEAEGRKLQTFPPPGTAAPGIDDRSVDTYLRSLGARPVTGAPCWPVPFPDPRCGGETNVIVHLTGTRDSSVSVTQMRGRKKDCRKTKAVTFITNGTQGTENIELSNINLDAADPVAFVRERNKEPKKRFFDESFLELRKGAAPARLNIMAQSKQTCTWVIEAEYESDGGIKKAGILDNNGKPLRVEAPPTDPEQYWIYDLQQNKYRLLSEEERNTAQQG